MYIRTEAPTLYSQSLLFIINRGTVFYMPFLFYFSNCFDVENRQIYYSPIYSILRATAFLRLTQISKAKQEIKLS